jgi:hypothetical protein
LRYWETTEVIRGLVKRVSILGLLVGGLATAERVGLCTTAGADVWNLPALEDELARHEVEGTQLDRAGAVIDQRIMTKHRLVCELAAGRRSLAEVADLFRDLNQDSPYTTETFTQMYGTSDPVEQSARNVLDFAQLHVYPSSAARSVTLRRLTAEFAQMCPHAITAD